MKIKIDSRDASKTEFLDDDGNPMPILATSVNVYVEAYHPPVVELTVFADVDVDGLEMLRARDGKWYNSNGDCLAGADPVLTPGVDVAAGIPPTPEGSSKATKKTRESGSLVTLEELFEFVKRLLTRRDAVVEVCEEMIKEMKITWR